MPISTTKAVSYVLSKVTCDMEAGRITAELRWTAGDIGSGVVEVFATGDDFAAILAAAPNGATRAEDIANLVYEFAITKGFVSGEIS